MSNLSKILGLFLTLMLCSTISNAEDTTKIRKQILKIADQIASYETVDNKGVGFAGETTEQYKRFIYLVDKATNSELLTLTSHENPKVRAYSFWALAKRNYKDIKIVCEKHLSDTSDFDFYSGCIISAKQVNYFILEILTPKYIDPFCYKLTKREISSYYDKIRSTVKLRN